MTIPFQPTAPDRLSAELSEGADAAANASTAYVMAPGDRFSGTLSALGDRDWVAVTLVAGQTYTIDMEGMGRGAGTLVDSYLRLYAANGAEIASDDDSGEGFDSRLVYTVTATGTYYIEAGSFADGDMGSYRITLSGSGSGSGGTGIGGTGGGGATLGTLDTMADYLVNGFWEGAPRVFDTSQSITITVNITALTLEGRQLARWAFEAWEMVADLQFQETGGAAMITFDDDEFGAFALSSFDFLGRITSSEVNVAADWITAYGATIDSYTFSTYVHEIGHALGLGHQGPYDGNASYPTDARFTNDSTQLSVMSYFSPTDNPTVFASYAEPITAMLVDIVAIQSLYGAPGAASATAGDTVWGAGSTLGMFLDLLYSGSPSYGGGAVAYTIYDRDGRDLLDLSFSATSDRITLVPEGISDVLGLVGNLAIARGTLIEEVRSGSGDDTLIGNAADNTLEAGAGSDLAYGGPGHDTLLGGAGDDTLGGFTGDDSIEGGDGADALWGAVGNDTLKGDGGNDTLGGSDGADSLEGGAGADALWGAVGNDTLKGDAGNDTLGGFTGNDSLEGGAGLDELWGAAGADTLKGGDDADRMGGGTENDSLEGGSGNDSLYGGLGDDTVWGGTGDDLIFGAPGADSLGGGFGDDTLYVGTGADVVVYGAGHGADEVWYFSAIEDRLELDDALWGGGLSAAQVVSTFGSTVGSDFVLDFGGGNSITLIGLGGTAGLDSQIDIF